MRDDGGLHDELGLFHLGDLGRNELLGGRLGELAFAGGNLFVGAAATATTHGLLLFGGLGNVFREGRDERGDFANFVLNDFAGAQEDEQGNDAAVDGEGADGTARFVA